MLMRPEIQPEVHRKLRLPKKKLTKNRSLSKRKRMSKSAITLHVYCLISELLIKIKFLIKFRVITWQSILEWSRLRNNIGGRTTGTIFGRPVNVVGTGMNSEERLLNTKIEFFEENKLIRQTTTESSADSFLSRASQSKSSRTDPGHRPPRSIPGPMPTSN